MSQNNNIEEKQQTYLQQRSAYKQESEQIQEENEIVLPERNNDKNLKIEQNKIENSESQDYNLQLFFNEDTIYKVERKSTIDTAEEEQKVINQEIKQFNFINHAWQIVVQYIDNTLEKSIPLNTIELFLCQFESVKNIQNLQRMNRISIFRDNALPLISNYFDGGCWNIKYYRNSKDIKYLNEDWKKLAFACIGEQFIDDIVLGIRALSREDDIIIEIWMDKFNDNQKREMSDRVYQILNLDQSQEFYFKYNSQFINKNGKDRFPRNRNYNNNYPQNQRRKKY